MLPEQAKSQNHKQLSPLLQSQALYPCLLCCNSSPCILKLMLSARPSLGPTWSPSLCHSHFLSFMIWSPQITVGTGPLGWAEVSRVGDRRQPYLLAASHFPSSLQGSGRYMHWWVVRGVVGITLQIWKNVSSMVKETEDAIK